MKVKENFEIAIITLTNFLENERLKLNKVYYLHSYRKTTVCSINSRLNGSWIIFKIIGIIFIKYINNLI